MASSDSTDPTPAGETLPRRLAHVVERFDDAWRSGRRPRIEEALDGTTLPQDLSTLLVRLISVEIGHRLRLGETPQPTEYAARFPELADEISRIDWSTFAGPGRDQSTILVSPVRRRFGRFELAERVGTGGFGEVWRAFDPHLQREVAIKLAHLGTSDDGPTLLHEAQSAGRLKHPGIVSVHEAGVEGETAFIVSDFIKGTALDARLKAGPLPFREAAEIARKLADAVAHAHDRGVLHRDIKPANVLIDASGVPHLTDFGVARRIAGDRTITTAGQAVGTPAYMPPEQAQGDITAIDQRSDVYALGMVLYEMIAGRRAYPGDLHEALRRVLLGPPPPVRTFRKDVPRDLETIVAVATARERTDRYPSAQALADDLGRFLNDAPVAARPLGPFERTWRWARRRPAAASLVSAALLALVSLPLLPSSVLSSILPRAIPLSTRPDPDPPQASPGPEPAAPSGGPAAMTPVLPPVAVEIHTDPPGARVWVFPKDPRTGWVLPRKRVGPREGERTAEGRGIRYDLTPGEHLIVADLGGDRFAEVTRWVPFPGDDLPADYSQLSWSRPSKGLVRLDVPIPDASLKGLVRFPGGTHVLLGSPSRPPRRLRIPPYFLAPREFTTADLWSVPRMPRMPDLGPLPPPDHAVPLRFDDAAEALERLGLRLPDEFEWESAAESAEPDWAAIAAEVAESREAEFGPAGFPEGDRVGPDPGVFGLRSNVAEWTVSWAVPLPWSFGLPQFPPPIEPDPKNPLGPTWARVVKGGDNLVLRGDPVVSDVKYGTAARLPVGRFNEPQPGLGFRAARSVKPRLEPKDFVEDLGSIDAPGAVGRDE